MEKNKVLASKFQIVIHLKNEFDYKYVNVHTRYEATTKNDILKLYITQDKIDEWKQELIKKIQNCKNPFKFYNGDYDCYEIDESEIFELPEDYVKPDHVIEEW